MTPDSMRHFFLWSLAANYVVLLVWFLAFVFVKDWIRNLHGKWFDFSDATFDAIHYSGMAIYKIGILLFNVVPFIALCILRTGN